MITKKFLKDFVNEGVFLENNGIQICCKLYRFRFKIFSGNTPAKASVLNVKGPTGYKSCTKCKIFGEKQYTKLKNGDCKASNIHFITVNHKVRRSQEYENFREDNSRIFDGDVSDDEYESPTFKPRTKIKPYHTGFTQVSRLKTLDLVDGFVVCSLHAAYEGAMERLMSAWKEGYHNCSNTGKTKREIFSQYQVSLI